MNGANYITSERNTCSCVATKAVANKALKKFWGFNGIRTHDLRDTGAMLYQLSYEASLEAGQVQVQFISVVWREWHDVYAIPLRIKNTGERDPLFWHCLFNDS